MTGFVVRGPSHIVQHGSVSPRRAVRLPRLLQRVAPQVGANLRQRRGDLHPTVRQYQQRRGRLGKACAQAVAHRLGNIAKFQHPHKIRGAALEIVERDFVKSAEVVGEKRWRIVFGEVLPNVTSPLLVEAGLRMTYSIGLVAGISFLGFGLQPPDADWGLMINENRLSITVQPWAVLLPVIAIGLLTVGTNLITDGLSRALAGIDRRADS